MGECNYFCGSQPGSPSLGTLGTGDLARILDAALVNGFTAQSITGITRVGTTATANKTAHGFLDQQRVTIAGAGQADYNITARITVIDADNFSYTVANSPATPATGTITATLAPLGWGVPFTATNQRVYRAATGVRHYLMINDNSNTNTCIVRAFVSMSAITTGTGPYPTTTQSTTNLKWPRPDPTFNTARDWVVIGDDKRFFVGINSNYNMSRSWHFFGEFKSFKPADAYNSLIMGYTNNDGSDSLTDSNAPHTNYNATTQGAGQYWNFPMAAARAYNQSTASYLLGPCAAHGANANLYNSFFVSSTAGLISPISGGIELCYVDLMEYVVPDQWRRGRLPIMGSHSHPDFVNNDKAVYKNITNFPNIILFSGTGGDQTNGCMFAIGDWDTVYG